MSILWQRLECMKKNLTPSPSPFQFFPVPTFLAPAEVLLPVFS